MSEEDMASRSQIGGAPKSAATEAKPSAASERPLRLCSYCQTWNSKPCGEGCGFSLRDPTWAQHEAAIAKAEANG